MNLTSPSQVRALLDSLGFEPSKLLGQNFLIDRNILDIIAGAAELKNSDQILEVGPGLGVLTERLVEEAAQVTAVEKDKRLVSYLGAKFGDTPNLRLINADMLDVSADEMTGAGVSKLVSNLPYSVGSRILVNMMMADTPPLLMVVTVQLEVARRIIAAPHGKEYGVLSVWAQAGYDVEIVKNVSPSCFWPKPEVTSAIVRFRKHNRFPMSLLQKKFFFEVTKKMFVHRRKQLASSLGRIPELVDIGLADAVKLLEKKGVNSRARPENLSAEEWYALVRELARG